MNITSPAENASIGSQDVDLRWTVEGNSFSVAFITISVDNGSEVRLPASATNYLISGAGEGTHRANITAEDGLGGSASQTISFAVNTTANAGNRAITSPDRDDSDRGCRHRDAGRCSGVRKTKDGLKGPSNA